MKQLALLSYVLTAIGLAVAAWAIVADASELWQLVGLLLVIAGVVKIAVVQIWQRIANL